MMRRGGFTKAWPYAVALFLVAALVVVWQVTRRRIPLEPQPAETKSAETHAVELSPQPETQPAEIAVPLPKALLAEVSNWPEQVVCFTSAQKPIQSLKGLSGQEILVSSPELTLLAQKMMAAAGNQGSCVGIRVLRPGEQASAFGKNSRTRLLIAVVGHGQGPLVRGAARVQFVGE
jgi:hypothetical protein